MKPPVFKAPTFTPPTIKRAPMASMVKAKDPLADVSDTGDIEADAKAEVTALQQAFRDRAAQEAARMQDATDTGYYTCVVFENRAQCEAWLLAIGKLGKGDLYLDGRDLAEFMKISLPAGGGGGKVGKVDGAWAKFTGLLKG